MRLSFTDVVVVAVRRDGGGELGRRRTERRIENNSNEMGETGTPLIETPNHKGNFKRNYDIRPAAESRFRGHVRRGLREMFFASSRKHTCVPRDIV